MLKHEGVIADLTQLHNGVHQHLGTTATLQVKRLRVSIQVMKDVKWKLLNPMTGKLQRHTEDEQTFL